MIKISIKANLNGIKAKSSVLKQRVTTMVADELLKKSEPYIPLDTSMLRDSGIMHSDRGKTKLIWDTLKSKNPQRVHKTSYAKWQWEYGTGRSNNPNGLRGRKWAMRAWADHKRTIMQNANNFLKNRK